MVDLQEPTKKEYSAEEQIALKKQFILLLHTLLLVYLGLHNFLIPLISNLLTGRFILSDLHFWFLFQIPVQFYLRQKKTIPSGYYYFLLLGTFARFGMELQLASSLKSWGVLSLTLSELSSIIFYYLYFPFLKKKSPSLFSLLAFLIVPAMSMIEIRSQRVISSETKAVTERDDENFGCRGSLNEITFPLRETALFSTETTIRSCGLADSLLRVGDSFKIHNKSSHDINLRLYRLRVLHGKVSWKFVRLVQISQNSLWDISTYLREEKTIFLLKSPERRKLGNIILLPREEYHFPIGKGKLTSTYDTLQWEPHHE